MNLREELGQASWFVKENSSKEAVRQWRRSRKGLTLPPLGVRRRVKGEVWGVTMVRDEEDVIALTVRHLLEQGLDHVLVADNLSQDGTRRILEELASRDPRIHLATDAEPAYFQRVKMSMLARAATRAGADWVVPFDADELWFAEDTSVKEFLVRIGATPTHGGESVGAVRALLYDTIPTGGPAPDLHDATFVMDSQPTPPGKIAVRSHPLVGLVVGNHGATRVGSVARGLHISHLQYRSVSQVERKARQGIEAVQLAELPDWIGAHWKVLADLDEAAIERTWAGMQLGEPQPHVHYYAQGPMVRVKPTTWQVWDPDHQLLPVGV